MVWHRKEHARNNGRSLSSFDDHICVCCCCCYHQSAWILFFVWLSCSISETCIRYHIACWQRNRRWALFINGLWRAPICIKLQVWAETMTSQYLCLPNVTSAQYSFVHFSILSARAHTFFSFNLFIHLFCCFWIFLLFRVVRSIFTPNREKIILLQESFNWNAYNDH